MLNRIKFVSTQNLQAHYARNYKTTTKLGATASTLTLDSTWEQAKPLHAIPGLKPLPIPLGNLWRFTRFGPYGNLNFFETNKELAEKYGPIVRVTGIGREDRIFLYDADYIQTMYKNDGPYPITNLVESFSLYIAKRKDGLFKYGTFGTSQGKQWRDNRSSVHNQMVIPKQAVVYVDPIDEVANSFINRMKYLRDQNLEMPKNFYDEISKSVLESVANYTLGIRLGCVEKDWNPKSDPEKLIINTRNFFYYINYLDMNFSPPIWKYISTPSWRNFVRGLDELFSICSKYGYNRLEEVKYLAKSTNYQPKSLLEVLSQDEKSARLAVLTVALLLIVGNELVTTSIASTMYYLSKNSDKQEKLFQELQKFLPKKDSPITSKTLTELKYLKACVKETLRLSPATFGSQRRATKDYVIDQYQIPKGTSVMAANSIVCKNEKYFQNSDSYLPERWLRSEKDLGFITKEAHPFANLPFGFGVRMCIGRRFAELGVEIAIAKIIRNFKVGYHHGDMSWTFEGVNKCAKPLQFKIEDRIE